jgi:PPOX class probable F420-dependent enzyme
METRTRSLTQAQREFLEQPFYGALTTLREDGSPQTTVVWVDVDDDGPLFNTVVGRAKERHLRRDPRLSLIVIDPQDAYRWLAVSGRAELTTESADDEIDKLAKKYVGQDEYPWRKPTEQRINVRIRPEHVETYGLD